MSDCIGVQAMSVDILGQVWLGAEVLLTESLARALLVGLTGDGCSYSEVKTY